MTQAKKHKVFISYHHEMDQAYRDRFVKIMADYIVDKSVDTGDIVDCNLPLDEIRRRIRDDFIADATVTVVLIGPCTWRRKHVDWEIGSSLSDTDNNDRCGLLGILLPEHPNFQKQEYDPRLVPPRLADNCNGDDSFALIQDWTRKTMEIRDWIHQAFLRRKKQPDPDNSREQFANNQKGKCAVGWQN